MVALSLVCLVALLVIVQCCVVHGQSCNEYCNLDEGLNCYGACSECVDNYCECPGGLSSCNFRDTDYFVCYNSTTEICCPNYFSHGNGAICPVSNECCGAFSYPTCSDPATSFCCGYALQAASCPLGQTCCGSEYPICVNETTHQCCCATQSSSGYGLACPYDNQCDCNNYQCVAPSTCGAVPYCEGYCCNDTINGQICYDASEYHCLTGPAATRLCANADELCGTTCYNTTTSTCNGGATLCGQQGYGGVCGGVECYDTTAYDCVNGNTLCPKGDLMCGPNCYSPSAYTCTDGFLCPAGTVSCNGACYNPSEYTCVNGALGPI